MGKRVLEAFVVSFVMGGVLAGGSPNALGWTLLAVMAALAVALPLLERRAQRRQVAARRLALRRRPLPAGLLPAPRDGQSHSLQR